MGLHPERPVRRKHYPIQEPNWSMTEQNFNRYISDTAEISLDGITLELAIKIPKHGSVDRRRYASAVGLLESEYN